MKKEKIFSVIFNVIIGIILAVAVVVILLNVLLYKFLSIPVPKNENIVWVCEEYDIRFSWSDEENLYAGEMEYYGEKIPVEVSLRPGNMHILSPGEIYHYIRPENCILRGYPDYGRKKIKLKVMGDNVDLFEGNRSTLEFKRYKKGEEPKSIEKKEPSMPKRIELTKEAKTFVCQNYDISFSWNEEKKCYTGRMNLEGEEKEIMVRVNNDEAYNLYFYDIKAAEDRKNLFDYYYFTTKTEYGKDYIKAELEFNYTDFFGGKVSDGNKRICFEFKKR